MIDIPALRYSQLQNSMAANSVPILDFTAYRQGNAVDQEQFVRSLGAALEEIGFLILKNAAVSPELIRRAYQVADQFFILPPPIKQQYETPHIRGQSGFTRFGQEHAKDALLPDLKEFWHINRNSLDSTNELWPQEVPEFRPILSRLYQQLEMCAQTLLAACAQYLGQPSTWLQDMVRDSNTLLRIAHYPPIPPDAPPGSLRAAPHEDINFITLLCEATAPGLEVRTVEGRWIPIQAKPGEIVVGTGDMLQNLTNGLFKSTTHRVVNANPQKRRLSMPFFVHPRPETDLTPHTFCLEKTGGISHYPSMTAHDYLNQRLMEIGLV